MSYRQVFSLSRVPRPIWYILVCIFWLLSCWVAYGQIINFEFVWDDKVLFTMSPIFEMEINSENAFELLSAFFNEAAFDAYYRPWPMLVLWGSIQLADGEPWLAHSVNLGIYLTTILLVAYILLRVLDKWPDLKFHERILIWFVGGSFFLFYPLHVEVVSWISGAFDLWCTLFICLALCVDLKRTRSRSDPVLVGGLFLLALLSKESAMIFILVYPLWRLFYEGLDGALNYTKLREGANTRIFLVLLAFLLLYILLRYITVGDRIDIHYAYTTSSDEWLSLVIVSVFAQVKALLIPVSSLFIQQTLLPPDLYLHNNAILSRLVALLFLLVATSIALLKRPHVGVFLCLLAVSMLPTLNILPNYFSQGVYVAPRFAYFPSLILSIGFVCLVAWGCTFRFSTKLRYSIGVVLGVLLGAHTVITDGNVPNWKNNESLFSWALNKSPFDPYLIEELLAVYEREGNTELQIMHCSELLNKFLKHSLSLTTCLKMLVSKGYKDDAIRMAKISIDQAIPGEYYVTAVHKYLSDMYLKDGSYKDSIYHSLETLKLTPKSQGANLNLAIAGLLDQQCDLADAALESLISSYPNYYPMKKKWNQRKPQGEWPIYLEFLKGKRAVAELMALALSCSG